MPGIDLNLDAIKSFAPKEAPEFGARLYEAVQNLVSRIGTLEQQVNGNTSGLPSAPPSVGSLQVTASNGHFHAAIVDQSPIYRGVKYFLEHADNPHFSNPHVEVLNDSRNWHDFLGNTTRYFRAYSSYGSSGPSAPVYFGSSVQPTAVSGGGSIPGPSYLASQGSGTGLPGQGLTGPGIVAFRSTNGKPPIRS